MSNNLLNNLLRVETWSIAADFNHIIHPSRHPNEAQIKHLAPSLADRIGGSILFAFSLLLIVPGCFYLYWASRKVKQIDCLIKGSPEERTIDLAKDAALFSTTPTPTPPAQDTPTTTPTPTPPAQDTPTTTPTPAPPAQDNPTTMPTPTPLAQDNPTTMPTPTPPAQDNPTTTPTPAPPAQDNPTTMPTPTPPAQDTPTTTPLVDSLAATFANKILEAAQMVLAKESLSDKKDAFDTFFSEKDHEKVERLQLLGDTPEGLNALYELCQHFSPSHWGILTDAQVLANAPKLLSKIPQDKNSRTVPLFRLFPANEKGTQRLRALFKQKPEDFYEISKDLSRAQWDRFDQSLGWELNFSKICARRREDALNTTLSQLLPKLGKGKKGLKKIKTIEKAFDNVSLKSVLFDEQELSSLAKLGAEEKGLEALYALSTQFKLKHWQALSDEQALALDLSKIENAQLRTALVGLYTGAHAHRIDKMSSEKVQYVLKLI
jgi:hypothetical protein